MSFQPLPCRTLFGPVYKGAILGEYQTDPHLCTFQLAQDVHITESHKLRPLQADYLFEPRQESFSDLLQRLPWEPELVIWYCLSLMPVPADIYACPYPTLAIVHDWHLNLQACLDLVEAFDYVACDRSFLQILRERGFQRADYWPCYSFDPGVHCLLPGVERDLDISFAGNLDYQYHRERNPWLERLLALGERHRVLLTDRYFGLRYTQLLNRSKIVFNRSIRSEMNMRAYEATACGALLFMERENLEIQDFLKDGESCVLYGDDDLEEKLDYYLQHPEARRKIAAAGYQAIQQHSPSHQFERLIPFFERAQTAFQTGARQAFGRAPKIWRSLVCARQILHSRAPAADERALQVLQRLEADPEISEAGHWLLQGCRAAMAINGCWRPDTLLRPEPPPPEARNALQVLQAVAQRFQSPLHHYNLACALTLNGHYAPALKVWQAFLPQLASYSLQLPDLSYSILLPAGNSQRKTDFGHLWPLVLGDILRQKRPPQDLNRLLAWQAWEQSAYCYLYTGQYTQAVQAFQRSIQSWPGNFYSYAPLIHLLLKQGRRQDMLAVLKHSVTHLGMAESLQRDWLLSLRQFPEAKAEDIAQAQLQYRRLMNYCEGGGTSEGVGLHVWLPQIMAWLPDVPPLPLRPISDKLSSDKPASEKEMR